MLWFPNEARYWAVKLRTDINIPPLMSDEDKSFGGSLVLAFRKRWSHVKTTRFLVCFSWGLVMFPRALNYIYYFLQWTGHNRFSVFNWNWRLMRGTMIQKSSVSFAFEKLSVATPPVSTIENIKMHGSIGREFPSLKSTVTIQFIQSLYIAVASLKTKSKRHCFTCKSLIA